MFDTAKEFKVVLNEFKNLDQETEDSIVEQILLMDDFKKYARERAALHDDMDALDWLNKNDLPSCFYLNPCPAPNWESEDSKNADEAIDQTEEDSKYFNTGEDDDTSSTDTEILFQTPFPDDLKSSKSNADDMRKGKKREKEDYLEDIRYQDIKEILREEPRAARYGEYDERAYTKALYDFYATIGLHPAKRKIEEIHDFAKLQRTLYERDLNIPELGFNMSFMGAPGTGKTIAARHYASIIKSLGILEKGHLVEVSKADLIGRYVGDTEEITARIFHSALDGILFIDEAHLIEPSYPWSFDNELMSTLLKLSEDFRRRIIIIFAGYEDGIKSNIYGFEGMKSRIPFEIKFKDYNAEELTRIFFHFCAKDNMRFDKSLSKKIEKSLRQYPRHSNLTLNAREVRNMYENLLLKRTKRLAKIINPSNDELITITEEDLDLIFPDSSNNVIHL